MLAGTARAWADGYRRLRKVQQNFAAGVTVRVGSQGSAITERVNDKTE